MQIIPRLKSVCVKCMLNSRINQYPEDATDEQKVEYMTRVFRELGEMKDAHGPILVTRNIINIQKEMFGSTQDYSDLKKRFNQFIMQKSPCLMENIQKSEDPLKLAIQYSIVGNLIDFIVLDSVDENRLEMMFAEATNYLLNDDVYHGLRCDVLNAKRIVVLLDNCGEIVLDKLMIELLKHCSIY